MGLLTLLAACPPTPLQLGALIAGMLLVASGALELGRRLPGPRARGAQAAALGCAAVALATIASVVAPDPWFARAPDVVLGGTLLAGLGLAFAAARDRVVFAVALVIPPLLGRLSCVDDQLALAGWALIAALTTNAAVHGAAAAPEQHARLTSGLRQAGVALWLRLGSASLLLSASGIAIASVQRFSLVAGSITGAISMTLFALALVRVVSASGTDVMPRYRLNVAASLALISASLWSIQALFVYRGLARPGWPILTPIVSALAIVALLSAIQRMAAHDEKLARSAATTTRVFVVVMALSLALVGLAGETRAGEAIHLLATLGGSIGVGALVLGATSCAKAAAVLDARPPLATATLRAPPV